MIATIRNRFVVREGRFGRVLIAFMVMGFAALIVAGIAAGLATARGEQHTETVGHTYEVELAIGTARRLIEQSEASRRGYLLTGDQAFLQPLKVLQAPRGEGFARFGQFVIPSIQHLRLCALFE